MPSKIQTQNKKPPLVGSKPTAHISKLSQKQEDVEEEDLDDVVNYKALVKDEKGNYTPRSQVALER